MPNSSFPPFHVISRSRRGVVLVIVLAFLVLIAVLITAFFSTVTTETSSAGSYANGANVKHLADSAVQLAIAQVVDATKGKDAAGNLLAWASQPGMIRTYDTSGNAAKLYKLYSSNQMVVSNGSAFDPASEVPPVNWDATANLGLFTDLNSPIVRTTSTGTDEFFPIIDPRAKSTDATQSIEGFDYTNVVNGTVLPGGDQRLPMPVRWLYVLQNGKTALSSTGNNGVITFDQTDATRVPSKSNPIVGRIAFWTDDDTCKINVNTASEGTFWDRPWANTTTEQEFSYTIPLQNEFQRYPGHPATTCLSPVLGTLFPSPNSGSSTLSASAIQSQLQTYYNLCPRISGSGGTQGGTVPDIKATAISSKIDRLYVSADEFYYTTSRNANTPITNTFLGKTKFFLTAQSRAPEINLFGKPRMTLWPLMTGTNQRNTKDKLIAFCSEIGGKPYYFQRASAYSSFGTASSSQDATSDWAITRNQNLYSYLDTLTSKAIPGFGGNFSTKYSNSRYQLLTEMFDMIRSGVNCYSPKNLGTNEPQYNYAPQLGDPGEGQIVPLAPDSGSGAGTRGFGRFSTITGAAVVFYRCNPASDPNPAIRAVLILEPFNPTPGLPVWSNNVHYVIKDLSGISVAAGGTGSTLTFPNPADNWVTGRVGYSAATNSTAGNTTAYSGLKACFRYAKNVGDNGDYVKTIGNSDPKTGYPFITGSAVLPAGANSFDFSTFSFKIEIYPGYSSSYGSTPLQTINMRFPGVTGLPLPTTATTGSDYDYNSRIGGGVGPYTGYTFPAPKDFRTHLMMSGTATSGTTTQDVARGLEPNPAAAPKGDLRIYAALADVPMDYFTKSPNYDTSVQFAQGLRDGSYAGNAADADYQVGYTTVSGTNRNLWLDDFDGTLLNGIPYFRRSKPAVPRGLNGAYLSGGAYPGDWDNGNGTIEDGPYINKPDEGNSDSKSLEKKGSIASAAYVTGSTASFLGISDTNYITGGYYSRGLVYGGTDDYVTLSGTTFSPNRQVSSAVMFGSLSTGVNPSDSSSQSPWQTLLFCPNPASGSNHPGLASPPDYLLLDLFTMPIVEPYAISEPFSTAGKINMNYQIMPFTYITRDTGVRAVLKSTRLMAIPTTASTTVGSNYSYKENNAYAFELRYKINLDESGGTLQGFADKFKKGDIFRSASEICSIYLVPEKIPGANYTSGISEPTYSTVANWWTNQGPSSKGFCLTGDNVRERPYGDLYPRLTTKSNTYTAHVRAQTLKKVPTTSAAQWVEGKDQVVGEFRSSTTIERYIDASDPSLNQVDFATDTSSKIAEDYYRIRILNSTTFTP
ncbi:MAG: Verru_Chthon cassette protein A [Chthoniobacteraceae bacterium]